MSVNGSCHIKPSSKAVSGPQVRMVFAPKGHLTVSGDSFDSHGWWVTLQCTGPLPTTENYRVQIVSSAASRHPARALTTRPLQWDSPGVYLPARFLIAITQYNLPVDTALQSRGFALYPVPAKEPGSNLVQPSAFTASARCSPP